MAVTVDQLVKRISAEHDKTLKFFKDLPDFVWGLQLYSDGEEWTVHQIFAHIVEAEGSFLKLFSNIASGGSGVQPDFDIDQHNAVEVGLISSKSRNDLMLLFSERRSEMVDLVGGFTSKTLENIGNHPYLGETTLGEMLRLYILHVNLHIRDIRKALVERKP